MNGFQILDKNNKAIPMNILDAEVAELWGFKPEVNTEYAKEYSRDHFEKGTKGCLKYYRQSNWFDTIGWTIADEGLSLQGILDKYADDFSKYIGKKDSKTGEVITLETIYPKRVLLINTWIAKGYKAKQVLEKDLY